MASFAITYNGIGTVTVSISGAVDGDVYSAIADVNPYPTAFGTVAGGALTLTLPGISESAGYTFDVWVHTGSDPFASSGDFTAATVFRVGDTAEFEFDTVWSYDGADTIDLEATFLAGIDYSLQPVDSTNGGWPATSFTGTGATQTVSVVAPLTPTGDYFYASVFRQDDFETLSNRLFTAGLAGGGFPGNPGGSAPPITSAPVFDGGAAFKAQT